MTHLVIKVYSFECDDLACEETLDVTPLPPLAGSLIDAARREMASEGWSCEPDADYCPKHRARPR